MLNIYFKRCRHSLRLQNETNPAITLHSFNWTNLRENPRSTYHVQRIFASIFRGKFGIANNSSSMIKYSNALSFEGEEEEKKEHVELRQNIYIFFYGT